MWGFQKLRTPTCVVSRPFAVNLSPRLGRAFRCHSDTQSLAWQNDSHVLILLPSWQRCIEGLFSMAWFCIFTLSVRSNTEGKAVGSAAVQSQELNKPVRICQNTTSAHDNAQITSLTLTFKDQPCGTCDTCSQIPLGNMCFLRFSPMISDVAKVATSCPNCSQTELH